jgi:hypothetical protein
MNQHPKPSTALHKNLIGKEDRNMNQIPLEMTDMHSGEILDDVVYSSFLSSTTGYIQGLHPHRKRIRIGEHKDRITILCNIGNGKTRT